MKRSIEVQERPNQQNTYSSFLMMHADGWRCIGLFLEITQDDLCQVYSLVSKKFNMLAWNYWSHFTPIHYQEKNMALDFVKKHDKFITKATMVNSMLPISPTIPMNFSRLKTLKISCCANIKHNVDLKALEELKMFDCLDVDFSKFSTPNLTTLFVHDSSFIELPDFLVCTTTIQSLSIQKFTSLKQIFFVNQSYSTIKNLTLLCFEDVLSLPLISCCKSLEYLYLECDSNDMKLPDNLHTLPLQTLIVNCQSVQNIEGIRNAKHLIYANFSNCSRLQNVSALITIPTLRRLRIFKTSIEQDDIDQIQLSNSKLKIYTARNFVS